MKITVTASILFLVGAFQTALADETWSCPKGSSFKKEKTVLNTTIQGCFNSEGIAHGRTKEFTTSGEITRDVHWTNGKQDGVTILYSNGKKMSVTEFKSGRKQGTEKAWMAQENIGWVSKYRNGERVEHKIVNKNPLE